MRRLMPDALTIFGVLLLAPGLRLAAAEPIVFGRDIRPLLADRCFACHGPDRNGQANELRLDVRDAALVGAIAPGKPAESELMVRLTSSDPDLRMPPADSGKAPLTPAEIAKVAQWIREGADYTAHWAYTTPTQSPLPTVKQTDWPLGPIDRFTLAGMEAHGFAPAAEADRRTLLRRLSFDVTGLPPTAEQVAQFQADTDPRAYENAVDRLLNSRHFGERMAIHWLDLVRYADTGGYHSDNPREVDAYRDYVIDAFNNNMPFDQFTVEQLAGDLLEGATISQKIASGYNRLLQTTEEGGAQPKEYTAIYQADRVRNVSTVWLATTMGCCQCHDHKFDPFTMREFYSLAAFFADVKEVPVGRQPANLRLPTPEQTAELDQLAADLARLNSQPIPADQQAAWTKAVAEQAAQANAAWMTVKPASLAAAQKTKLDVQPDLSVLASGPNPATETYTVTLAAKDVPAGDKPITAFRLEALTHPSLSSGGASRANGNFVLTGVELALQTPGAEPVALKLSKATADFEQPGFPVAHTLDADPQTGWAVSGHEKKASRTAAFFLEQPLTLAADATLVLTLRHESQHAQHVIGRFRVSLSRAENPAASGGLDYPADLLAAVAVAPTQWTPEQQKLVDAQFRARAPEWEPVRKEIAAKDTRRKLVDSQVRTMLVSESGPPRMVRVLPRGNWLDDSGPVVEPNTPAALGTLAVKDRRPTRLDLARWLVQDDHPLTARVFVNRVWMLLFGQGIARSVEDFGFQSDWPTHPDLLDWLAVDFVEHGWDVKRLIKQILMSRTYRQQSAVPATVAQRDPFNIWIARQGRHRLNAEMVRDNALLVSGLLVDQIGGPSVKPYQPAGYWQHLNFPAREWQNDGSGNQFRRGVYTFWCRSFLHPSLLAFDATSREECTAQRPRSNTPMQALVLLNDPTYVEAATALAGQIATQSGGRDRQMDWAMQRVLQRSPTAAETEVLSPLVGSDPAQRESWLPVARVLLNLHETITRY